MGIFLFKLEGLLRLLRELTSPCPLQRGRIFPFQGKKEELKFE